LLPGNGILLGLLALPNFRNAFCRGGGVMASNGLTPPTLMLITRAAILLGVLLPTGQGLAFMIVLLRGELVLLGV